VAQHRIVRPGYTVIHPNRDKPICKLTRILVALILLVSIVLMLALTIGGWTKLQGMKPINFIWCLMYLIVAYFILRWARGLLPLAAALAILLLIIACIAAFGLDGTSWFDRTHTGFGEAQSLFGGKGLGTGVLGSLTLILIPLEIALIENIQREDLNPIEEAHAYHQLHQDFGLTQEEISRRVGKERSTVANFLRLLKLPETVKELLASGQLSMGHARALLAVESAKRQEQLASRVVARDLSVRQTELLTSVTPRRKSKQEKPKDVFTRDAGEKLTRTLRTKVDIDRKRRGGVIHIRFASEDDLIRIFDELTGRRR